MKINLDKYYTPTDVAQYCIDKTLDIIGKENITDVIEPSAGNGSFSKLLDCTAYDLEPEDNSIIRQDFLALDISYKRGRLFIGNPPFGSRNTLSVRFFKKCVVLGDYIAFILPISQYSNQQQMYEFDLIHSEVLPEIKYSGRPLLTCFNIYKRPKHGINKNRPDYTLDFVKITEFRRGGNNNIPDDYDYAICGWGGGIGKQIEHECQYALEMYIQITDRKDEVIELLNAANWQELYPSIATPRLPQWKVYKYLRDNLKDTL